MKKLKILTFTIIMFFAGSQQISAQIYNTAAGLSIDFGDGITLAGPMVKHFFNSHNAGQAELVFGNGVSVLQAIYSYNSGISGASGLNWMVGAGGALAFGSGNTELGIRPMAGLEYKITNVPLSLSLEWRPALWITEGDSDMGRFGMGFKFTF